jgi:hypothetical protein
VVTPAPQVACSQLFCILSCFPMIVHTHCNPVRLARSHCLCVHPRFDQRIR